jgi:DNA invertase Pin-like site-specific DNA recombinase
MRAAIYVRVSLSDGSQTNDNQRQQLSEFIKRMGWELVVEFSDQKSGKSLDRPGFKKMMAAAGRREFDVLVTWDLSRLTRSGVRDVLNTLEMLKSWGVAYRSLQEPYIDTLGPFSDVIVALLACIAKLEREKISERTLAGLARARKHGRVGGRPKVLENPKLTASIAKFKASGHSIRQIAKLLQKSPTTIQKYAE